MELLIASMIGLLTAGGVYLLLRARSFSVVLGLTLLSYAVNLFLLAMGRLATHLPPIVQPGRSNYVDPVPQALVLTAIVIGFGMTAFVIALALCAKAQAFLDGRAFATPDDVKAVARAVLRHRLGLSYEAQAENTTPEDVVEKILSGVIVP